MCDQFIYPGITAAAGPLCIASTSLVWSQPFMFAHDSTPIFLSPIVIRPSGAGGRCGCCGAAFRLPRSPKSHIAVLGRARLIGCAGTPPRNRRRICSRGPSPVCSRGSSPPAQEHIAHRSVGCCTAGRRTRSLLTRNVVVVQGYPGQHGGLPNLLVVCVVSFSLFSILFMWAKPVSLWGHRPLCSFAHTSTCPPPRSLDP